MKELFGLEHLLISEMETTEKTDSTFQKGCQLFAEAIDLCFKLPYFVGDTNCNQNNSYPFFVQSPHTLWTAYSLWEKGYYLEAFNIYRHLFEMLIKTKYFFLKPDKYKLFLQTRRANFKTICSDFSPELHDYCYDYLSKYTHNPLWNHIVRTDMNQNNYSMGCHYLDDLANPFAHYLARYLKSYYHTFKYIYNNNLLSEHPDINLKLDNIIRWLETDEKEMRSMNPASNKFYDCFDEFDSK